MATERIDFQKEADNLRWSGKDVWQYPPDQHQDFEPQGAAYYDSRHASTDSQQSPLTGTHRVSPVDSKFSPDCQDTPPSDAIMAEPGHEEKRRIQMRRGHSYNGKYPITIGFFRVQICQWRCLPTFPLE